MTPAHRRPALIARHRSVAARRLARAAHAALAVSDSLETRRLFADFAFNSDFFSEAVATYPDGRFIVVGYQDDEPNSVSSGRKDVLRRFNADGSPDDSFGEGGKVVVRVDEDGDGDDDDTAAYAVVIQDDDADDPNDGKILVAGSTYASVNEGDDEDELISFNPSFTLSSFNADGTPNEAFGGGRIRIDLSPGNTNNSDIAYAIAFQGNRVLVAGQTGDYSSRDSDDFAIVRYNANGTRDGSFGDGGLIATDVQADSDDDSFRDSIGALLVEDDGKIVVAGTAGRVERDGYVYSLVGVCRYTADGDLDKTFSGDGMLVLSQLGTERYPDPTFQSFNSQSSDFTVGLAQTSDGKYIVAASTPDGVRDFGMVKLNRNGTLDDSFGDDGFVRTGMGGIDDADQVLLVGNSIVVIGTTANGAYPSGEKVFVDDNEDGEPDNPDAPRPVTFRTAIAVFTSDGDLDDDFGDEGKALFDQVTVTPPPDAIGPQAIHIGDIARRAKAAANGGDVVVSRSNDVDDSILRRLSVDVAAPTATLAPVPAVTSAGGTGNDLVVTFSDVAAIDVSTIATSNILVQRPGGMAVGVLSATPDSATDGATRTATYRLIAPGGTWDSTDNDTYTVTLQAGQVADINGNTIGTKNLGTFTVNVAATAPSAAFSATSIAAPGGTTHTFTVTYTDADGLVARGSLAPENVTVTGPNGPVTVLGVTAAPDADAASIVATYTVQAPGGTWDASDTGDYVVALVANQVRDTANNFTPAAATLGTFAANLGGVPGAPSAALEPVGAVNAGAATHTFKVTYTDNTGINVSSLNTSDVTVVRNGGTQLAVSNATVDTNSNGSPRTVTYTVQAPGGSWNAADTGTYTIALAANQVADVDGTFAPAGSLGSFTVNLGGGTGSGAAAVADVTTRGSSSYEFTVNYSPTVGTTLSAATLGDDDLRVVGPGGFTTFAQFGAVSGNTVTYRFLPPGGTWNAKDAGAYTVSLQPGSVLDTTGGQVGSGNLGTFNVAIASAGTSLGTFGTVNGVLTKFPVTDADGTVTLLSLTGGGSGEVFQSGDRFDLVLTGTTGASALSLKPKGGDGRIRLGDVTVDGGLKQLSGKTADLSGEFSAGSAVGKILLGNLQDASITVGAGGLTTIQLGQVTNASLTSTSPIKSLKLAGWADDGADDVITVPDLQSVNAKGDFAADVNVQFLGNVKITGGLVGANLVSTGNIGKVTAGSMTNSRAFAAVVAPAGGLPAAASDLSNDTTPLGAVSVKGAFSNSLIAGPAIGKIALGSVQTTNGGTPFGVAASRIRSASANASGKITLKNAEDPSQTVGQGDFTIRIL